MGQQLIDLSIPFDESVPRWNVKFETVYNTTSYMATTVHFSVHTATHLDSPLHYVPGAVDITGFPVEWTIREALVIDLSYVTENYPIEVKDLEPFFTSDYPRTIILRTDWPERYWGTMKYWEVSPYVTENAAKWLAEKDIDIIGYDFPQDYIIRKIASGGAKLDDFIVHKILTAKGIWQLEYMANLSSLKSNRIEMIICPLPLKGVEASPVRVFGRPL